jgi:hypothetical protein
MAKAKPLGKTKRKPLARKLRLVAASKNKENPSSFYKALETRPP